MSFNQIKCPACNAWYTEYEWNKNTVEIVSRLNEGINNITPIEKRFAGCFYSCPNQKCQDEVVTSESLSLAIKGNE